MPLNISVAKLVWKCLVLEAWSSLSPWLRPRWVVEAPAQDQSLRLTRGNYPSRIASMNQVICILSQTYTGKAGSPETIHLEIDCQEWASYLVFGRVREVRIFPFFR